MNPEDQSRYEYLYELHCATLRLRGMATKTIDAYSRAVRRISIHFDACPEHLSTEQLVEYFHALVESHSWSTVKLDRNGLAFFYRFVLKRDMPWVEMVKPPVVRSLPDVLTSDELARIIVRTQSLRYRTFWVLCASTGLRLSEALHLGVADIDAGTMRLHIRHGKGRKDRFVVMPRLTTLWLRKQWASHRHPSLLFPGKPGLHGEPAASVMDRGTTQRAFARVVGDCNIHKKVSIHSLRHSYATRLIEIGLNLSGVQQLLGHSSPQTTVRHVRMSERNLLAHTDAANRLAGELAGALRALRQPPASAVRGCERPVNRRTLRTRP